ncbi:MAG: DNA primase [Clostridiales bacterium]|nr:DNA primase [Clostridiales bacterium]
MRDDDQTKGYKMPRFGDAWMETLLSKNDIVSLVSEYVSLRQKGGKLWGVCPFHSEKTPSFSVTPDKQLYYCFGCGAGGGIIQFVIAIERLSYIEAVQFLARRAGMQLPDEMDDENIRRERMKKDRLYEITKAAALFFYRRLIGEDGKPARQYFARRGIDSDIVKSFGLGYAPDSWDMLLNHLKGLGYKEADMVSAGLLVKNAKTGNVYDAYRNRVTFPIIGANMKVLGFGARTMGDDTPKYINTGDTPLYAKRNNLYALNILKGVKTPDAIMVEGYMDVISLYAAGVKNAVASLGTALTQQQARLLKRYVNTVYIAYDGDSAGQNATLRGLDILAKEELTVRVVLLPEGVDPDDFVRREGADAFKNLKDNAVSLNAFKLMRIARGYDLNNEEGRHDYAVDACAFIAGLQPVEQERYYATLAAQTGIPLEALRAQGARQGVSPASFEPALRRIGGRKRLRENLAQRTRAQVTLLHLMLQAPAVMDLFADGGLTGGGPQGDYEIDELFIDKPLNDFAKDLVAAYKSGEEPDIALLMSKLTGEQSQLVAGAVDRRPPEGDVTRMARDCIRHIRVMDMDEELRELGAMLDTDTLPLDEKLEISKRMQELARKRKAL